MFTQTMKYFHQITQIPRPSGQEEQIRSWIIKRAKKKWYTYKTDQVGNVVIYVPATSGYEEKETVIIQWHMDMVCVQKPGGTHDFNKDPIQTYEEDGRLKAKETTLWADNGIALAMMLACVEYPHPTLELFFTVDEERWLTGALEFDPQLLQWTKLLNLDTEDEWEICISSAWWWRIDVQKNITRITGKYKQYKILNGQWWHSWVDIHLNRANALQELTKCILWYTQDYELCTIQWWQADNAIPAEAESIIGIQDEQGFKSHCKQYEKKLQDSYNEPTIMIKIQETQTNNEAIQNSGEILQTIADIPNGVQSMHPSIEWLVQTSVNLGIVETKNDLIHLTYAPRSSDNNAMDILLDTMKKTFIQWWRDMQLRAIYPWRSQNPDDQFVQETKKIYDAVTKKDTQIVAYHAWLECWAIVGNLTQKVQAVSIWPTIKNPHSIHEKVYIPSVEKLCTIVQKIIETT